MNHKDLEVWKSSIRLVTSIYRLTKKLPKEERFGLSSQMQRSAVSIASNIAEGCARNSDPQLLHFINVAIGSIAELETELIIANRIHDIMVEDELNLLVKVRRLTLGTRNHLELKK